MPDLTFDDFNKAARETAYAAVGFGLIGFQRAQVRRRELTEALAGRSPDFAQFSEQVNAQLQMAAGTVRPQLEAVAAQLQEVGTAVRPQLEAVAAQLQEVGTAVGAQSAVARTQVTDLIKAVDERVAPARRELDARIDEVGSRLPASTRNALQQLRAAATAPEQALRSALGLDRDDDQPTD